MKRNENLPKDITKLVSTEEFARANGVKPGTVRSSYCRCGEYMGLVPRKKKNGRLLWPAEVPMLDESVSDEL